MNVEYAGAYQDLVMWPRLLNDTGLSEPDCNAIGPFCVLRRGK